MNDKRYFFVTGLPRSRTAWLANFLTWGDCMCFHDIHGWTHTVLKTMRDCPAQVVGFSNSVALLMWREFRVAFPQARWVVIERDHDEAFEASVEAFGPAYTEAFHKALCAELDQLRAPLRIPFNAIDESSCEALLDYLSLPPQLPERISLLCKLNIQVNPPLLKKAQAQALPQTLALA